MSDCGAFIWYELMTADIAAAREFYRAVLGWEIAESGPSPIDYHQIAAPDGEFVGGILALSAEMLAGGAQPGWYGYIDVDDVDAEIAALKAAGGSVFMDQTIPDVGRMALVADPQGVPVYLMKPQPPAGTPDGVSTAFAPGRTGHVAWNELTTPDPAGAKRYYLERFGWRQDGAMPMPGLGEYEFLYRGDAMIGAIMPQPEKAPAGWHLYWKVDDIDAARTRLEAAGGSVTNGPHEVPGGDFVIDATDPHGVRFGLTGKRN
jgi:uncharacterized protein